MGKTYGQFLPKMLRPDASWIVDGEDVSRDGESDSGWVSHCTRKEKKSFRQYGYRGFREEIVRTMSPNLFKIGNHRLGVLMQSLDDLWNDVHLNEHAVCSRSRIFVIDESAGNGTHDGLSIALGFHDGLLDLG